MHIITKIIKKYQRDESRCFVCALKHRFQDRLFVCLCPCSDRQLSDLNCLIIQNSNLTTRHITLTVDHFNGATEVLERWHLHAVAKHHFRDTTYYKLDDKTNIMTKLESLHLSLHQIL